jgi:hypothetical protein
MTKENLIWSGVHSRINRSDIQLVENRFGIQFPEDFIEIVLQYHGGFPRPNRFVYQDYEKGPVRSSLAELLSFDLSYRDNIINTYEYLEHQLPTGVIPFADDGGGDYICFDFGSTRDSSTPKVVYWSHEKEPELSTTYLSDTFSDFLALLIE